MSMLPRRPRPRVTSSKISPSRSTRRKRRAVVNCAERSPIFCRTTTWLPAPRRSRKVHPVLAGWLATRSDYRLEVQRLGLASRSGLRLESGAKSELPGTVRNECANGRCQFLGDRHHRLRRVIESGLVFRNRLILAQRFVVMEHTPDAFLVPPRRKIGRVLHLSFLLMRRRKATSGLPLNSYAVMTKTWSGSRSGT